MVVNLRRLVRSERTGRVLAWLPAWAVIAASIWYLLAFLQIYFVPHAYESASDWIYENVPPGSVLLGVHWDDRLPIGRPGRDAHQYHFEGDDVTLALYELPDTLDKMSMSAARMAQADYIIFPTYRLPGSIPRIPKEYPYSTRLFQLLFDGKLGFELVKTFKDRPNLLGVTFDDDLSDESFTVYDHPKVAIFKKMENLSQAELMGRIVNPGRFAPLLTFDEVMTKNNASNGTPAATMRWNLGAVLIWFLTIQLISFAVLPLFVWIAPGLVDRGYGLSKTFGVVLFGLMAWWPPALGLAAASRFTTLTSLAVLCCLGASIFLRINREDVKAAVKGHARGVEALFLGVSAVFLVIRFFNPEIVWGEKPMDSTFLSFLLRNTTLPPQDPWAAGHYMQYYYVGIYFLAALLKLTGITASVGYNLAIATLGGLIAAGLYSIFVSFGRSAIWAMGGALVYVFASNFEAFRLWAAEGKPATFDAIFWPSSRVFTSPAFAEYTFWSLIFADLHAHVVAIPFTVLVLGLSAALWKSAPFRFTTSGILGRVALGFALAVLYVANTWDFISLGAFIGLLLLFAPYEDFWAPPRLPGGQAASGERALAFLVSKGSAVVWDFFIIIMAALAVMTPYAMQSGAAARISWGWVQAFEFNTLDQVVRFIGHWILIVFVSSFVILTVRIDILKKAPALLVAALVATYPFVLAGCAIWQGFGGTPWPIVVSAAILMFLGTLLWFGGESLRFGGLLLTAAAGLLVTAELVFLIDRMNTIFKAYMSLWLLFGVSALLLWREASKLISLGKWYAEIAKETRLALNLAACLCLLLPIAGSVINVRAVLAMRRISERVFSLDGAAYLEKLDGDEARLIAWMKRNISGTPVQLEAQGDSYREFTRIAMHTGLPTVLGWEYHVQQRGLSHFMVEQRKHDIRAIYGTPDVKEAEQLLLEYGVDLIVVGNVERRTYNSAGLQKFENAPDRFPVLFRSGRVVLYAAPHSNWNPMRGSRLRSAIER